MQSIDLQTLTEPEIKALGYDQIKLLQVTQNNIAAIETELKRRAKIEDVKQHISD